MERFGIEGQKIKAKVAHALKNSEKLSQKELDAVWEESLEFVKTLPEEKRAAFYWYSGLECLFMFVSVSKVQ